MKTAKDIALVSVYTALLLGGQLIFSGVAGVEVVTVLFAAFCYRFGAKRGLLTANAFSLLRGFVFGFFPTVLILYLIYYNLFACVFGWLGKRLGKSFNIKIHFLLLGISVLMTVVFTLLDNVITPWYYAYSPEAAKAYWYASLYTLLTQSICTAVTITLLLPPLLKVFTVIKI